ncbi:MAG: tRNA (adenosine(37)-N6)-threonylcarbamoyltransferase complex transferase subunit TsaD, partial [Oligoflexia bacterium]|nr:tRNA (adenosine(37)-N6)-threonylcarbamoyltransferase complex transferase subunit TsaD [Oligoflexia bacterium]
MKTFFLGIETSCDETAAAVVDSDSNVLSNVVFSQVDLHKKYGGVVPELASRDHALKISCVVKEAINGSGLSVGDINYVSVANGPGLLGCLLVGVSFAKSFAMSRNIPLIPVDHVQSHLFSVFMDGTGTEKEGPAYPFAGLVVSGGHTSVYLVNSPSDVRVIGSTIDDAAGEVFDKVARFAGLGYPGGRIINSLASTGNPEAVRFKKPVIKGRENDFSFSGLKTAVITYLKESNVELSPDSRALKDVLAAFQEHICALLAEKLVDLALMYN